MWVRTTLTIKKDGLRKRVAAKLTFGTRASAPVKGRGGRLGAGLGRALEDRLPRPEANAPKSKLNC